MRLRMQNSKLYVVKLNEQDWELDQAVVTAFVVHT